LISKPVAEPLIDARDNAELPPPRPTRRAQRGARNAERGARSPRPSPAGARRDLDVDAPIKG